MKKVFAFLLALALLCPAASGWASSIVTDGIDLSEIPALQVFAELRASVPDQYGRVTVTLSKPVDRIWANWMGEGELPQELYLKDDLTATFSTKGHKYQVGALPPCGQGLYKEETGDRHVISFGALPSQINWRAIQAQRDAKTGDQVEVVEPRWILYRASDGVVFDEFADTHICTDIDVPDGFVLQKVDGYAVSWRYASNGSDGSPNLAYITLQGDYIVVYARNGKIQYVAKYEPGELVFGIQIDDPALVDSFSYDKDTGEETGRRLTHYTIPENVSEFEGLPELPPVYTFAGMSPVRSKDGKKITVFLTKPVDGLWANWMGRDELPEELTVSSKLTATFSTEGHKYQVGAQWVSGQGQVERGPKHTIGWQAYPSNINYVTMKAYQDRHHGDCVKVVLPHWEVVRISSGAVVKTYSDELNCTDIHVDPGYKLVKKLGYAVAWYPSTVASDGSPNLAYITLQKGFTVLYNRAGKAVGIYKTVPNTNLFCAGCGTATIHYEISEFGRWYVSEVTEVYDSNRSITATYSKYGTGDLVDYQVSDF